jgi:hypothetical protein
VLSESQHPEFTESIELTLPEGNIRAAGHPGNNYAAAQGYPSVQTAASAAVPVVPAASRGRQASVRQYRSAMRKETLHLQVVRRRPLHYKSLAKRRPV